MYIEHPFFYDGKYFAKVDGEFIEISKEVAYAMNNFYRSSKPRTVDKKDDKGNVIERKRREVPCSETLGDEGFSMIELIPDLYCDVAEEAVSRVVGEDVNRAIDKLSEIEKIIVRGIYFEDMTQEEVSRLLGVSYQAVSKRLKSILAKMRNLLNE